ncbi:MAG: helix-turn-helix domain-containing protein [Methylocystis sp.]
MSDFHSIDAARRERGLTVTRLCRIAGVSRTTWQRFSNRSVGRWNRDTIRKFERALSGRSGHAPIAPRNADPLLLAASYRAYVAVLARETGCEPEKILASDPSIRATASPEWAQAAWLRALAVYCVVVEFGVASSRVAAAIGVTKQAASQMCRRVTDRRDDGNELDLLLERVGKMISGRE